MNKNLNFKKNTLMLINKTNRKMIKIIKNLNLFKIKLIMIKVNINSKTMRINIIRKENITNVDSAICIQSTNQMIHSA